MGKVPQHAVLRLGYKMPRMKKIDQPVEEDLEKFKDDLQKAILKMLSQPNSSLSNNLKNELTARSWEQLYLRIFEEMKQLLKEKDRS